MTLLATNVPRNGYAMNASDRAELRRTMAGVPAGVLRTMADELRVIAAEREAGTPCQCARCRPAKHGARKLSFTPQPIFPKDGPDTRGMGILSGPKSIFDPAA